MSAEAPSHRSSNPALAKSTAGGSQLRREAWAIECNPLYTLGGLCLLCGLGLWIGNLTHLLVTFRGSALLAIFLGFVLWHLGVCFPRRRPL